MDKMANSKFRIPKPRQRLFPPYALRPLSGDLQGPVPYARRNACLNL